jgi:low temperature requirement protein LtrA
VSAVASEPASHQKVGWFELFYDLVIVAAVSYGSHVLLADPTWSMAWQIAFSMLVMLVLWLLTSLNNNLFPGDHPWRRILTLVQMLALVIAALSTGGSEGLPDQLGFIALSVAFATVAVMYAMAGHSHVSDGRDARLVAYSSALASAVLLTGGFLPHGSGSAETVTVVGVLTVGVGLAAVPLLGPFIGRLCALGQVDDEHLGERVGQLVIIVLGESFVSLVSALSGKAEIPNPVYLVLTFVVVFAIWTMYFSSVVPAGVPSRAGWLRLWLLGHWGLMFGAVAAAVGFSALASVPFGDEGTSASWTTSPLLVVMASLAMLTWVSCRAVTRLVVLHLLAGLVLAVLAIIAVTETAGGVNWEVAVGSLVVILDAVIAVRWVRPYAPVTPAGAEETRPLGTDPSPS